MEHSASSNKDSKKPKRNHREVNRELSLYVKGIIDGMNKRVINKAFETFGTVTNLDVVPSKSCAFVEFDTKEACQHALAQKSIYIPNLGTVTVEERRAKGQKLAENLWTPIVEGVKVKGQETENLGTPIVEGVKVKGQETENLGAVMVDERKQRSRELSLYVKGIIDGMNKRVINKAFETFGNVKDLTVVPSKSCAFVEFDTKEACQHALAQKSIYIPNLGTVTVEERRARGQKLAENLGTPIVEGVKVKGQETENLGTPIVEGVKVKGQETENLWTPIVEGVKVKGQETENLGAVMVYEREQRSRELSLYVKGIIDGMNKRVVNKAFETFGTVTNLDVVPSKSCAFVEFATEEAYQKALTQERIEIPNLGIVTVEKRKPKTQNHRNRYKTSNS